MTPETKKYLLIGGGIIVVGAIGVALWKRSQGNTAAQGADAQQQSDELALVSAALASNAYGGQQGGAQTFSPATGVATPPSLVDELTQLEQALGLAPTPAPVASNNGAPNVGGSSPGTSSVPTSPSPARNAPSTGTDVGGGEPVINGPHSEIAYNATDKPVFDRQHLVEEGIIVE